MSIPNNRRHVEKVGLYLVVSGSVLSAPYITFNACNLYTLFSSFLPLSYDSGLYPTMDATWNWWGQGKQSYVDGRIWHRDDDDNLFQVLYQPFHETNTSLIQGKSIENGSKKW